MPLSILLTCMVVGHSTGRNRTVYIQRRHQSWFLIDSVTSSMFGRQHSCGNMLYTGTNSHSDQKHGGMKRTKSKQLLLRRRSSVCMNKHDKNNNTEHCSGVSSGVKHLLLKHSKLGFIKNFLHATNQCVHSRSELEKSDHWVPVEDLCSNTSDAADCASKTIKREEFELSHFLGAGGFGSVYKGTFHGKEVAIKIMHKFTKNPEAQLESFKAELHVMSFSHPNIVRTLAATCIEEFDKGAWVVMEYVGHGRTLHSLLNDLNTPVNAEVRLKYGRQIASALAYAHERRVVHLDLKPANILLTESLDCKVGDFGCSQRVYNDSGVISPTGRSLLTGTFAYCAPELLRGEAPTFKADVYSYGVCLWQMKSRETPFAHCNQHVAIFGVVANGLRPPDLSPSETDPFELSYKDLYRQCWKACPLDRPSAKELADVMNIWQASV